MASAVGPVAQKETKYTQGFDFRLDVSGEDRARQLVERSCTSLLSLLQELFLQVEREGMEQLRSTADTQVRRRLLQVLGDIVRIRSGVERSVLDAVICAFAALEDYASGERRNRAAIDQTLMLYKNGQGGGPTDLVQLLRADERIVQANNQDRPLLVHLNAQLAVVFAMQETRLRNSPLAPATLTGGMLAGLLVSRADMAAKEMLFRGYATHFLPRLTMLLNSMAMRLEEEGVQILKAASFDEMDAGPVAEVLQYHQARVPPQLAGRLKGLLSLLESSREYRVAPSPVRETIRQEIAAHPDTGSVALFSELGRLKQYLEPAVRRADVQAQEVAELHSLREAIAARLNQALNGKRLPAVVERFAAQQWADVCFEYAAREGLDGPSAEMLATCLQELVESVTPLADESRRGDLGRCVPRLVKSLRETLQAADFTLTDTHEFFEQLKQLHLANVQQRLDDSGFVTWQTLSLAGRVPPEVPVASDSDRALYEQARVLAG